MAALNSLIMLLCVNILLIKAIVSDPVIADDTTQKSINSNPDDYSGGGNRWQHSQEKETVQESEEDSSESSAEGLEREGSSTMDTSNTEGNINTDDMQIDIPLGDKNISLHLKHNPNILSSIPILLGTNKYSHVQLDTTKLTGITAYQDIERNATFVMWDTADDNSGIRGLFDDDGKTFSVEPIEDSRSMYTDVVHSEISPQITYFKGKYVQVSPVVRQNADVEDLVRENILHNQNTERHQDSEHEDHQRRKRSRHNYEVELFIFIDYSIFRKWTRKSKAFYYEQREAEAINNIRFYYAHILNGIDMRYKNVREYDFEINIRPVGMYIAKSSKASYFTEYSPFNQQGIYVEAYDALDEFQSWINSDKSNLPSFDQISLFTAHNLFSGYIHSGKRRTFNGISDIGGVCGYRRASLSQDLGQFITIQTSAHELGHSIGAYHDGYNNWCSGNDQFIMAVSPGELNSRNQNNPYSFSPCSIQDFREHLHRITSNKENCLLQRANYYPDRSFQYFLHQQPGERFTADEQCEITYGSGSYYCGGGHLDEELCSEMQCWSPDHRKCVISREQRAADGTLCGNRKWCSAGMCVFNSHAPYTDKDSCIYGDYKDFVMDTESYKCTRIAPHKCYDETQNEICCETCDRLRDESKPGCEYGDREPSICRQILKSDCYRSDVQTRCCKTCAQMKTDIESCEYGDRAIWCLIYDSRRCYDSSHQRTCCETCERNKVGPTGCEYGNRIPHCTSRNCENSQHECCETCPLFDAPGNCEDKASWCSYIRASDCYSVDNICCSKCRRHRRPSNNCRYGNRFSWCASRYCDTMSSECCESCQ